MTAVCPFHDFSAEFDPLDLTNPFPLLAAAQAEEPIFYSPDIGYWVVTRHEEIKAIFRDHETFTAENTITPIVPFSDEVRALLAAGNYTPEPVLSNNVPPKHTRIRALVNKLFTPRRMAHFAPAIRDVARQFIARFAELGEVDIVAALTYEFPAQVLFHVLGVPAADVPQVKAWAGNRIKLYYGRPTAEEQIAMTGNLVPFWRYVVNLVAAKAANPTDDLTSDLIRLRAGDDAVLTLNEIASCMITLLVAGHETTTSQITNGLLHWLSQPGEWARLCQEPELIAAAVEEMLRFDPSVNAWRRLVRRPVTVAGVDLPAGANLLLMLNAANRDPAIFPEPDKIDVGRANLKEHLAFGYGIHYCVGAPLARLEMAILFEELTGRFPNLSLVPDQPIRYVPNISFRGPQKLMVRW
ncbi:MAG: cytochrome P450 [Ardenticatenales bacterium]|nr:cytochrome P450 [Ardenticatenales bacterium]